MPSQPNVPPLPPDLLRRMLNSLTNSGRFLILARLGLCFSCVTLLAEDRVTYTPAGMTGAVTASGDILNSTGMRLTLQQLNGDPLTIPADSVRNIQTTYDAAFVRGRQQFATGDDVAAVNSFREALGREPREWVQREILAALCQCAQRQQDPARALVHFRQLVETDPSTRFWGIAPLVWTPTTVPANVRTDAQAWLKSTRPTDRLIGASWLLLDATLGREAQRALQDLVRDTNPRTSDYSRAQLWRMDLARRSVTELSLESWRDQISRMPEDVRGGPQYLLAKGSESLGNTRVAAAEMLWLPYGYPQSEPLCSRALLEAGELLEKTGLVREATVVYQEQIIRYAVYPETPQSRSRFAALTSSR